MVKIILCLMLGLSTLSMSRHVFAQDDPPANSSDTMLFHWYTESGPDWGMALLLGGLGLFGALITTYSVIGGVLPGTAGKANIDKEQARLDEWQEKFSKLTDQQAPNERVLAEVNSAITNLRTDLSKEKWRQFWLGFVFYTVIGAVFASAVARDMIQAVLLGAAWTSFLGLFGLKEDFTVRKSAKDKILKQTEQMMAVLESEMQQSVGSDDDDIGAEFDISQMRKEIRTAQTL